MFVPSLLTHLPNEFSPLSFSSEVCTESCEDLQWMNPRLLQGLYVGQFCPHEAYVCRVIEQSVDNKLNLISSNTIIRGK